MMTDEDKKKIIESAFNTGICIDDEFAEPYSDDGDKDMPKALYESFKVIGHCCLDFYKFKDYDSYNNDKSFILDNKDFVVLDWELNPNNQFKADDTLKVMEDCFKSPAIKFICVYTNVPNLTNILYQLLSAFSKDTIDTEVELKVKADIDDILVNNSEITIDDLDTVLKDDIDNFITSKKKDKIPNLVKTIEDITSQDCKNKILQSLKGNGFSLEGFISRLCYNKNASKSLDKKGNYDCNVLGDDILLVSDTLILLCSKSLGNDDNHGIKPSNLLNRICDSILNIHNYKTFILTSFIRKPIHTSLATLGSGLLNINEVAFIKHASKYDNKYDLANYISTILGIQFRNILRSHLHETNIDIFELFQNEDRGKIEDKELLRLDSWITFSPKEEMNITDKRFENGDVFRLNTPFIENDLGKYSYIMCISPECDCLRHQEKLFDNVAFCFGKQETNLKTVLKNIEKKEYTILPNMEAIEWSTQFITINIKNLQTFSINKKVIVHIGENQKEEMVYLGNMKDIFAHRIANKVFSNAMRIGLDLPNLA